LKAPYSSRERVLSDAVEHEVTPRIQAEMAGLRKEMDRLLERGEATRAVDVLFDLLEQAHAETERVGQTAKHYARLYFGRKSERLSKNDLAQLLLAFGATEAEANADAPLLPTPEVPSELKDDAQNGDGASKKRKHPGRTPLDPALERDVTETRVPVPERACVRCGSEMSALGHQTHERVEYVSAKIVVHEERREKLGCKACRGDAVTAPRTRAPGVVGRADASVLAHLVEAKCDDAQPIQRQADQFSRLGWRVSNNTLYGYWKHACEMLEPVAALTQSLVFGGKVVGVDDTHVDFLEPKKGGRKKRGHLWAAANKGGMIAYWFTESWRAEDVAATLAAAEHFVQVDDYKGYSAVLERADGSVGPVVDPERRLGCGMHIRRRFEQALRSGDRRAAIPMDLFRRIYAIEDTIRGAPPDERLEVRQVHSIPLVEEFDDWVQRHEERFRPTELLERARGYAGHQGTYFRRCFTDGDFEIDNGDIERGMRRPAMGRRNWLFTGASTGGPRLAVAFTLVGSSRRLGLPTREYLIDVLLKLEAGWPARRALELTPIEWGRARGLLPSGR